MTASQARNERRRKRKQQDWYVSNPKFSIRTEVLGGGGQWQRQRLRQTPPPCTVQLMLFC